MAVFSHKPGNKTGFAIGVLVLVLALIQVAGVGLAQAPLVVDAEIDVLLNGRLFPAGGVVEGDRTFVRLADVAESIGARYVYDAAIGVAFVQTGVHANLNWQRLTELNPKLNEGYTAITPRLGLPGVEYAASSITHLGVVTSPAGEVLAFDFLLPAQIVGYFPWFDQEEGQTIDDGLYTHHLYVVDPALLQSLASSESRDVHVVFNGVALDLPADALRWHGDDLYVKLRDIAAASGGGVGWNVETRTASAKIVPGDDLIGFKLMDLNGGMDDYFMEDGFVPGVGMYASLPGPGIYVTFGADWRVTSFIVGYDPRLVDWEPWFDQEEDQPGHPIFGPVYTIHHFVLPADEIIAPE